MPITLSVKTVYVKADETDAVIASALNDAITYTSIYGVGVFPLSNSLWKIVIVYA